MRYSTIVGSLRRRPAATPAVSNPGQRAEAELADLIEELSAQMMTAAQHLQFEVAARLRDEIEDLKKELRAMKRAH